MMHKCSSSQGNMVGPCSCDMYSLMSPSPSSSVDCTLSLGTPSTRLSEDDEKRIRHDQRRSGSCMTNFCWDFLQTKNSPYAPQNHKTSRGSNSNTISNNSTNDPLLARRCANCDTTSTPLWRNGPRGPKSLCNACGIRFKKEERRATAANANANANSGNASGVAEQHHGYYNNSWAHQTQTQKMPCFSPAANEFRFIEDSDQTSDNTGIPFLSWRLNVADRPGLVHDFTR
ncbi:putative GATA transcription factor [Melia azedarach]|uniref:GATA transcription factor n=1 Tax=Melia azedarach TaxID=155640 RepID=A0ACC1XU19_MELAZ|nr:putative GATA transcription factor [Melia azedarach]